jgi:hypothetical protein
MATHDVTITKIPPFLVGGNDVFFEIREDGAKLGELRVSQGNLHWVPAGHTYGYTLDWGQFAEIAVEAGIREKYTY